MLVVFKYCPNPLLFHLQQAQTTSPITAVDRIVCTFLKQFLRVFVSLSLITVGIKKSHVVKVQQLSFHHHLMCSVPKQLQLILFALANTNYPVIILAFQPCLH